MMAMGKAMMMSMLLRIRHGLDDHNKATKQVEFEEQEIPNALLVAVGPSRFLARASIRRTPNTPRGGS